MQEDGRLLLKERGYLIGECIWRTEYGAVYRAVREDTGERVICKHQKGRLLEWEAEILARDRGILLPKRLDYNTLGDEGFLVMEEVKGESLRHRIDRKGGMGAGRVRRLGIRISGHMMELYQRTGIICHGDIKPEHVWLKGDRIRILDVGASLCKGASPGFGAPERLSDYPCHEREDVFSLACVLVFALGGELPDVMTLQLLGKKEFGGLGRRLIEVLRRAMETEPLNRIQSMGELNGLLREIARPWKSRVGHQRSGRGMGQSYDKDIWMYGDMGRDKYNYEFTRR